MDVLIVEDEEFDENAIRKTIKDLESDFLGDIESCATLEEARTMWAGGEWECRVVVLDLLLEDAQLSDSLDFLTEIVEERNEKGRTYPAVVVCTNLHQEERRCLELGADLFISKRDTHWWRGFSTSGLVDLLDEGVLQEKRRHARDRTQQKESIGHAALRAFRQLMSGAKSVVLLTMPCTTRSVP